MSACIEKVGEGEGAAYVVYVGGRCVLYQDAAAYNLTLNFDAADGLCKQVNWTLIIVDNEDISNWIKSKQPDDHWIGARMVSY